MDRFRSVTVGVVIVAGLLAGGVAMAQGPRGGGPGGRGGPLGPGGGFPALGQLDLSDAQKTQVREIRDRHREEMKTALTQLETARQKQRAAVEKVPADEAQIAASIESLTPLEVEVAIQASRMKAEIWNVLTPAQQAQVKKIQADRQARSQERGQRFEQRRQQRQQ